MVLQSKSYHIKDLLKREILDGQLKPGDRFYSQRQIAERFGVAGMTASKVLDLLQDESFVIRQSGKGTFVSEQKRTYSIGYLYNSNISLDYPWVSKLQAGIGRVCYKHNSRSMVMGIPSERISLAMGKGVIDDITNKRIDGLLLNISIDDDFMLELKHLGVPVVCIENREKNFDASWPLVTINLFAVGYEGVRHLYQQGYRQIAIMVNMTGHAHERFIDGYKHAVNELGIDSNPILNSSWSSEDACKTFCETYSKFKPDAILCMDDILAMGVQWGIRHLELDYSELGVVGAGNFMAMRTDLSLTTFETHVEQVGDCATRTLIDMLEHKPITTMTQYIEPQLIVRDSSTPGASWFNAGEILKDISNEKISICAVEKKEVI